MVHADESCLGNQNQGSNPGGASALVEAHGRSGIERRDLYLSSPGTTNNRMALQGAIEVFNRLSHRGQRRRILYFSDSQYLVRGMNEWIGRWKANGWRRKGGQIENLDLWKTLDHAAAQHDVRFGWVRGHIGNPKNEYSDYLAVRAATDQSDSGGLVTSGLLDWLARQRQRGAYLDFDPDQHFLRISSQHEETASGIQRWRSR
jgi:ribonuclease HI